MFKDIQPHLARKEMKFCGNKLGTEKAKRKQLSIDIQLLSCFACTPNRAVLEPILADLDRLWEIRHWIPEPGKPVDYKSLRAV